MDQNQEPFANAYDEEDRHGGQMGEELEEEFGHRPLDAVSEEWDEEIPDLHGIDVVREDLE